jgi:flagellum-specific peptidoglycan hydrolase FlgJ
MRGNNFGGLKGESPSGGSSVLWTREGFGPGEQRIRSRFRSYATPEQGARDYVETLAARYPEATSAARAGDLDGFVRGLEKRRYFTADPGAYRRGLGALLGEHERLEKAPIRPPTLASAGPALDGLLWALARATAKKSG